MLSLRTRRTLAATGTAALGLLPLLAAHPSVAADPIGPTAPGPRSSVGGELLTTTEAVRMPTPGVPPMPAVSATSFLVADLDSGEVIAARDPHGAYAPASTIKILTALALMPELAPEALVRPTTEDISVEGSKVGLLDTMSYPAAQLFEGLMLDSGNDAARALATAVGGMEAAAALMNAEAERLGAADTLAVNTSGLDAPGQVTSAYDLALISRAAMVRPDFRALAAQPRANISAPGGKTFEIQNHNKLIGSYEGALGIKNGYTSKALTSFVGAAQRDGRTVLITMMRANSRPHLEAAQLLDWGFAAMAAGAEPVGILVPPGPTAEQAAAAAAEQEAAEAAPVIEAAPTVGGGSGLPLLPTGLLLVGLAGGFVLVRKHQELTLAERYEIAARLATG